MVSSGIGYCDVLGSTGLPWLTTVSSVAEGSIGAVGLFFCGAIEGCSFSCYPTVGALLDPKDLESNRILEMVHRNVLDYTPRGNFASGAAKKAYHVQ